MKKFLNKNPKNNKDFLTLISHFANIKININTKMPWKNRKKEGFHSKDIKKGLRSIAYWASTYYFTVK